MKAFIATIQTTKQQQPITICFDSLESFLKYLVVNSETIIQHTGRFVDYITASDLCNEENKE